jgi:transcriptional regulator with XRE-family HTH domain
METFGKRLERLRTQRGLTRYAVFKATGISQQLLKHLEGVSSGGSVHGRTLLRLARFYELTIEELLGPLDDEEDAHAA